MILKLFSFQGKNTTYKPLKIKWPEKYMVLQEFKKVRNFGNRKRRDTAIYIVPLGIVRPVKLRRLRRQKGRKRNVCCTLLLNGFTGGILEK
jgi:hypothetical protein